MSKLHDHIYTEVIASITCAGCGNVDDANCDTDHEARFHLERSIERDGWAVVDGEMSGRFAGPLKRSAPTEN